MSAARIAAIMGAIWGLIVGIMIVVGLSVTNFTGRMFQGFEMMGIGPAIGIVGLVAFPILYGISGFIGGYVLALLYNWVAKKFGGVKVDL